MKRALWDLNDLSERDVRLQSVSGKVLLKKYLM